MAENGNSNRLVTFCHIPKTAGMAVRYLFAKRFGWRHMQTSAWKLGNRYAAADLRFDLRLNPFTRSIGGHQLRPFVDFEEIEPRLVWFTFLREPLARLVSQYVFDVGTGKIKGLSFAEWLQRDMDNWQVRWLAGEPDLEKAKRFLATRMACVGIQEHFIESMLLVRKRLGIERLEVATAGRINATKRSGTKEQVLAELDNCREIFFDRHALDVELYQYALEQIWPRQVQEYGPEQLRRDAEHVRSDIGRRSRGAEMRLLQHNAYRACVYKPAIATFRTVRGLPRSLSVLRCGSR